MWMNSEIKSGRDLNPDCNPNASENISRYVSCVVDSLKQISVRLLYGEISCQHKLMHKTVECLQGVWMFAGGDVAADK